MVKDDPIYKIPFSIAGAGLVYYLWEFGLNPRPVDAHEARGESSSIAGAPFYANEVNIVVSEEGKRVISVEGSK